MHQDKKPNANNPKYLIRITKELRSTTRDHSRRMTDTQEVKYNNSIKIIPW